MVCDVAQWLSLPGTKKVFIWGSHTAVLDCVTESPCLLQMCNRNWLQPYSDKAIQELNVLEGQGASSYYLEVLKNCMLPVDLISPALQPLSTFPRSQKTRP